MTTNTNNMNENMSPGEVALEVERERRLNEAKKNRQAEKAKLRAATPEVERERRLNEAKKNRQAEKAKLRAATPETQPTKSSYEGDWMDIFLTLMRNRDAKGVKDAVALIDITDEIFDALEEAGKI